MTLVRRHWVFVGMVLAAGVVLWRVKTLRWALLLVVLGMVL